ncbi:unnamed protein product [Nyctereutes procyonoides]|uniref:(raccoon dog) hypothetical protein n=1 Tax=Nyctereutes procyonoides TaxID=34880 RepID=A0A811ZBB3_NYCPR|nr:unnamed protein product [Nyctereutes procyonoides]
MGMGSILLQCGSALCKCIHSSLLVCEFKKEPFGKSPALFWTVTPTLHKSARRLYHFAEFLERERGREAETQAEGEAGSMHREPDVGFDPGSPGSRPGPKAGAKPLRHPGIPNFKFSHIFG